jgi:hypothetical protein
VRGEFEQELKHTKSGESTRQSYNVIDGWIPAPGKRANLAWILDSRQIVA